MPLIETLIRPGLRRIRAHDAIDRAKRFRRSLGIRNSRMFGASGLPIFNASAIPSFKCGGSTPETCTGCSGATTIVQCVFVGITPCTACAVNLTAGESSASGWNPNTTQNAPYFSGTGGGDCNWARGDNSIIVSGTYQTGPGAPCSISPVYFYYFISVYFDSSTGTVYLYMGGNTAANNTANNFPATGSYFEGSASFSGMCSGGSTTITNTLTVPCCTAFPLPCTGEPIATGGTCTLSFI